MNARMNAPVPQEAIAHGATLRRRFENLLEWLHLECNRGQIDAESTYDHADKLLAVVAEMRFVDARALGKITDQTKASAMLSALGDIQ